MTDSNEESGGLPTAAIVDNPNSAEYEHCLKIPVASKEMSENVLEWGDELVRKSDVKALIQDKIKNIQQMEKKQSHSLILQGYREARRKLEELLEELKND